MRPSRRDPAAPVLPGPPRGEPGAHPPTRSLAPSLGAGPEPRTPPRLWAGVLPLYNGHTRPYRPKALNPPPYGGSSTPPDPSPHRAAAPCRAISRRRAGSRRSARVWPPRCPLRALAACWRVGTSSSSSPVAIRVGLRLGCEARENPRLGPLRRGTPCPGRYGPPGESQALRSVVPQFENKGRQETPDLGTGIAYT